MPERKAELHPEAEAEFLAAVEWYVERSPGVAAAFIQEVDRAIGLLEE